MALDDYINSKTGKKIFGCAALFDRAAKINQSQYAWSQNIVSIGLLTVVKGRWTCLPIAFRFSGQFATTPLLSVTDSRLGNDDLFKTMRKTIGQDARILSRLRVNAALFELPMRVKGRLNRPRKYGQKLDCATALAKQSERYAKSHSSSLYSRPCEALA